MNNIGAVLVEKTFEIIQKGNWKSFFMFFLILLVGVMFYIVKIVCDTLVVVSSHLKEWRLYEANIKNFSIGGVQNILERGIEEKIPPK